MRYCVHARGDYIFEWAFQIPPPQPKKQRTPNGVLFALVMKVSSVGEQTKPIKIHASACLSYREDIRNDFYRLC